MVLRHGWPPYLVTLWSLYMTVQEDMVTKVKVKSVYKFYLVTW